MKPVIYRDKDGFIRRSLIKDEDDESDASLGLPYGPPDLRQLDWNELHKQINNTLAENETFSWDDVQHSQAGVQAALNIFKRALLALYRHEHIEKRSRNNAS